MAEGYLVTFHKIKKNNKTLIKLDIFRKASLFSGVQINNLLLKMD